MAIGDWASTLGRATSMFTGGEGTPWGAAGQARPDRPKYITDPMQVSGYDSSGLAKSYKNAFMNRQADAKNQALASMARSGNLGGADTQRALTDIAAQTELGLADIDAQQAYKDYQSRVDMMDRLNRLTQAQYEGDLASAKEDEAGRAAAIKNMFTGGLAVGDAAAKWFGQKNASK